MFHSFSQFLVVCYINAYNIIHLEKLGYYI
nr:MAG TPA: hypothetical protein [Caudoviricetes sp.]